MRRNLGAGDRRVVRIASKNVTAVGKVLRALHVFLYFPPDFTGEGIYFAKLAPLLDGLGIRSDVAVAASWPAPTGAIPGVGVVHRFVDGGTKSHPWGNRPLLFWFLLNAWRYDIVHFHCFVDRLFLLHIIARCFGCRVVQSATLDDGLGMAVDGYSARHRGLVRRMCRLIHHVVAISPHLFDDTLRVFPRPRVSLIPQGVQWRRLSPSGPDRRAAARAALGFLPQDMVLLFVGGISGRKDIHLLLDAMPALRHGSGSVRLLVVGPDLDGDYAASVRQRAQSLGEGVVSFAGFMEDPTPAYVAADIFVFASRREGFGNVLIEAMAAGLPVVARRLPGVTDSFIVDGENGLLFSDRETYERHVTRLLDDAALRRRIGGAARTVAAVHDLAGTAQRYSAVYRGATEPAEADADATGPAETIYPAVGGRANP
jgi:glycosyltransferase involved in cell wall biosynthesis